MPGYFKAIRRVCDKYGVLLVLDEIMCGMGRTGKMHAWEWEGQCREYPVSISCADGQGLFQMFRQSGKG